MATVIGLIMNSKCQQTLVAYIFFIIKIIASIRRYIVDKYKKIEDIMKFIITIITKNLLFSKKFCST